MQQEKELRMTDQRKDELDETIVDLGFKSFMAQPTHKKLISMVPGVEGQPELLMTLLRSAYDQGAAIGQIALTLAVIDARHKL